MYSYVLPCARFEEHLRLFGSIPSSAYEPVVTFDDGHISNYTHGFPLLERFGTRAHFFITAGWTGERQGYMEPQHLRVLYEAGHTIGAHGWTHALLTQCDSGKLRHELCDARAALEDIIGGPVRSMSLPGGRSNPAVLRACRDAGYTTVWTSVPGSLSTITEPLAGRFNVLAGHTDELLRRLLDPTSGELTQAARMGRWKAVAQRAMGDRLYARLWALLNHKEGGAEEPASLESAQNPSEVPSGGGSGNASQGATGSVAQ